MDWFDLPEEEVEEATKEDKKSCAIGGTKCPVCNNPVKPGDCVCSNCGSSTS